MARPIYLPAKNFNDRQIPASNLPTQTWWRIHAVQRQALNFSTNPGHRFSPSENAVEVLYLAADINTCLWEIFGDEILAGSTVLSLAAWSTRVISKIHLSPTLVSTHKLCNLNSTATRTALGCDLSSLFHHDLSIPQKWAEAIQKHPKSFAGLLYTSRFTRKRCLALFSPPSNKKKLKVLNTTPLTENTHTLTFLTKNKIALI